MTTLREAQMKKFKLGDYVAKTSGSKWVGRIVGEYSTELTPEGYAVESSTEHGSVQIYPAKALELAANHSERDLDMVTATPKRKPLTDEEIFGLYESTSFDWVQGKSSKGIEVLFARAIERAHGIGSEE